MKTLKIFLLIIITINLFGGESRFKIANDLLLKKDYDSAVFYYYDIIDNGLESSELYFNLGLCYLQKNEYLVSKQYFEQSHHLKPTEQALNKIQFCNKKISTFQTPKMFYKEWWINFKNLMSNNSWIYLSFIFISSIIILIMLIHFLKIKVTYILFLLILFNSLLYLVISSKENEKKQTFIKESQKNNFLSN